MRFLLYDSDDPQQIYQKLLNGEWARLRRRFAQEIAYLLMMQNQLPAGDRALLTVEHIWLESDLESPERALQALHVSACTGEGTVVGGQRVAATDLALSLARRTIQGMVAAEQVEPGARVVFMVTGNPQDEGDQVEETFRLPPAIDLREHPGLGRQVETALADARCGDCAKAACDRRPAAFAAGMLDSIAAWHGEQSQDGAEVGGVLLGYAVQGAPGNTRVLIVDHLPVLDEEATPLRWTMRGEHWDMVLRAVGERQAAGDPNLLICGSWHSHDALAISRAAGEPEPEDCGESKLLLPSPEDMFLFETHFSLPYHVNGIYDPHSGELSLYSWRQGQTIHALPLWIADLPHALPAGGQEAH